MTQSPRPKQAAHRRSKEIFNFAHASSPSLKIQNGRIAFPFLPPHVLRDLNSLQQRFCPLTRTHPATSYLLSALSASSRLRSPFFPGSAMAAVLRPGGYEWVKRWQSRGRASGLPWSCSFSAIGVLYIRFGVRLFCSIRVSMKGGHSS